MTAHENVSGRRPGATLLWWDPHPGRSAQGNCDKLAKSASLEIWWNLSHTFLLFHTHLSVRHRRTCASFSRNITLKSVAEWLCHNSWSRWKSDRSWTEPHGWPLYGFRQTPKTSPSSLASTCSQEPPHWSTLCSEDCAPGCRRKSKVALFAVDMKGPSLFCKKVQDSGEATHQPDLAVRFVASQREMQWIDVMIQVHTIVELLQMIDTDGKE